MAILSRTERAMIQAMFGVKQLARKNTEELMDILGIEKHLDSMAKASSMLWNAHVLQG